ncbi:MAG: hypothetical protein OEL55_06625 [Desulfobulbaceae bacterium]|nr:hypothetical protein [Desulfobulbaceae bacterium]
MPKNNNKRETSLKLAEIARELRRIADNLEKQEFDIGAGRINVGEPTFLKTRSEFKGDTAYFSLSIKMKTAESAKEEAKQIKPAKASKPKKQRSSGSGEAKKVKKEINRLWKDLRRKIEAQEKPNQADNKSLLKLWEDYTMFAEAAWSDEWRSCKNEVERCQRAAMNNQWQEAKSAAQEVNRLTKECHRQHK